MNGHLTENQRKYIIYHLDLFVEISPAIQDRIVFGVKEEGKICFFSQAEEYDFKKVKWLKGMPVLFPGDDRKEFYNFEYGSIYFNHDLFKSAFYLLSGYREYGTKEKDALGRFPYSASVQKELDIIYRPLVNEYFDIILEGFERYCEYHGLAFKRRTKDKAFLFLTHDVDRIDKYTFHTVKAAFKKAKKTKAFLWLIKWLNPFYKKNPKWTYDYLEKCEKERRIHSCYYFLNKDVKHIDSYYSFTDERISRLITRLEKNGHSIGLHGGIRSCDDPIKISKDLELLNSVCRKPVQGNRQHRLSYKHPNTMRHLEENELLYDTTLGFAQHEGFRNSFCHPFKLYDFENDRMIDVWEIPLNVMDGTLFTYRNLTKEEAQKSVEKIITEVKRYNGVFTLLFHPDFLDEEERPGIRTFYESILDKCKSADLQSLTGGDILKKLGGF